MDIKSLYIFIANTLYAILSKIIDVFAFIFQIFSSIILFPILLLGFVLGITLSPIELIEKKFSKNNKNDA